MRRRQNLNEKPTTLTFEFNLKCIFRTHESAANYIPTRLCWKKMMPTSTQPDDALWIALSGMMLL
jgi:hypothetical protein